MGSFNWGAAAPIVAPVSSLSGLAAQRISGVDDKRLEPAIFGDRQNAGILGMGQYRSNGFNIDQSAFTDDSQAQAQRTQLAAAIAAAGGRQAPQMATPMIDQSQQAQFRNNQLALVQALQAQANGQGPSLAQGQLQQATDRNISQAMALAATHGSNPALANRQLAYQTSAANQQAAGQSALLSAQEQMAARSALAQALESGRNADIDLAAKQGQLAYQSGAANLQAGINQTQLNDQSQLGYQKLFADNLQNYYSRLAAGQELGVKNALGVEGVNQGAYAAAGKARSDFLSKLGEGITSIATKPKTPTT